MKLTELLLNGFSFNQILKQFSVDGSGISIKDEDLILSSRDLNNIEILKERILIQGKNTSQEVISMLGTLHYNILNQLAVFELDSVERKSVA